MTRDVRALWVTRTTLTSPESIGQMVAAAQAGGFNTLLVQVRGRGDAYYAARSNRGRPSWPASQRSIRSRRSITDAHAAGLQVHAWVAVNLVSSSVSLPASRDHVIYRAPDG